MLPPVLDWLDEEPLLPDASPMLASASASRALYPEPSASLALCPEPSVSRAFCPEPSVYRALYPEPSASRALCPEPSVYRALSPEPSASLALCPEPSVVYHALCPEPSASRALYHALSPEPSASRSLCPEPSVSRALSPEPALANGVTSSHAASGAHNDAQVHAPLSDLNEHVTLMHNECIKCLRESDEHTERKLSGIRHDIATLRDELKQEFAALRLDFAKQFDDIRAKLSQILSFIITRPAAPSPACQQRPPPHICEASASQPEFVNRILKRKGNTEVERVEGDNVSLPQTPVNDKVIIFGATNGKWQDLVEGWRYGGDSGRGYIVSIPKVCGYNELVEKLCEELDIDRCLHDLELTASFNEKFPPVPIKKDKDVKCLISLCRRDGCNALCVNTKTKNTK